MGLGIYIYIFLGLFVCDGGLFVCDGGGLVGREGGLIWFGGSQKEKVD